MGLNEGEVRMRGPCMKRCEHTAQALCHLLKAIRRAAAEASNDTDSWALGVSTQLLVLLQKMAPFAHSFPARSIDPRSPRLKLRPNQKLVN